VRRVVGRRAAHASDVQLEGGHSLHTTGRKGQAAGVGILLHGRHADKPKTIRRVSDRVMAIDICMRGPPSTLVAAYLPHAGRTLEEVETAHEQLDWCIDGAKGERRAFSIGVDFQTDLLGDPRADKLRGWSEQHELRNLCLSGAGAVPMCRGMICGRSQAAWADNASSTTSSQTPRVRSST